MGPPTDRYSMKYRPRALVVVCHRSPVDVLVTWTIGLLDRRAVSIEHAAFDRRAGGALRRERWMAQSSDAARPRTASAVPILECFGELLELGSAMCPLGRLELLESAEGFEPAPARRPHGVRCEVNRVTAGIPGPRRRSGPALGVHSVARMSPFALVLTPTIWPNSFSSSASHRRRRAWAGAASRARHPQERLTVCRR